MSLVLVFLKDDLSKTLYRIPVAVEVGATQFRRESPNNTDEDLESGLAILVEHSCLVPIYSAGELEYIIPPGSLIVYGDTRASTKIAETAQPLQVTGPIRTIQFE